MIFHVVIRLAYTATAAFCEYLNTSSVKYVVGEHIADEEITTTHCHFAIEWNKTRQALEKGMKTTNVNGREISSILEKTQKTKELYDFDLLTIYITKGNVDIIKNSKGLQDTQIAALAARWVPPQTNQVVPPGEKVSKEVKDRTRWQVVQDVIEESQKIRGVWITMNENGIGLQTDTPGFRIKEFRVVWNILIKHLNKNKISTTRNELERMWLTILRHDPTKQEELYHSIHQSIFRGL